jgi:DNA-binding transcriptional LysR family regulator
MNLRALKYLVSLADQGSFTAAAKAHFVTQPAVSIQLQKLQDELGTRLFEVHGKVVRFTQAGEVVLDYARKLMSVEGEMLREIEDFSGLRKGRLALGTIDAASIYVLPGVFSRFNERYPGIEIYLEINSTNELLGGLDRGELDLIVGTLPVAERNRFEIHPIFTEDLVLIAPARHPLTKEPAIGLQKLAEYSFIFFHKGSVTRRIIEKVLGDNGITPRVTMDIDSPEAIKNLVASGLGLSVLPMRIVRDEVEKGSIAILEVEGLAFERSLGLIRAKERYLSSTAGAFIRILEEGLGIELPASFHSGASRSRGEKR